MPRRNSKGRGPRGGGHRMSRKEAFRKRHQPRNDNTQGPIAEHSDEAQTGHPPSLRPQRHTQRSGSGPAPSKFSSSRMPSEKFDRHSFAAQFKRQPTEASREKFIEGRVDIHPDGFGFLIAKDPKAPNVYIGEESLKYVMNRDIVRARITHSFDDGKMRGNVVEILERHQRELLGVYRPYKGGALVVPLEARDRKHAFKVATINPKVGELSSGTAVLCKILSYPDSVQGSVEIEGVLQDPEAPSVDTLRVLLEAAWPREHSKAAVSEAAHNAEAWQSRLEEDRRDIRDLPLVTIDGRDARDFDDAVCAKKEGSSIRLWVAIADVSFFVRPGTALDREAYERSTSVYFPDFVVPMLPEVLSNGVCSLNPFEDRACLVCEALINAQGKVVNYDIYPGLMKSKKRLTYEQAQAFIEGESWASDELAEVQESMTQLIEIFHRLNAARMRRGAIDLDIPEAQILLNSDGSVKDIQARTRLDAHRLIEECMLCANECVAAFLNEECHEGIYRIHEQPDPERVAALLAYVQLAGVNIASKNRGASTKGPPKGRKKSPRSEGTAQFDEPGDFAKLLDHIKEELGAENPTSRAIQTLMLRSLKQARYSSERLGHFALATMDYTHFTSPIRRYPDLIVHRLIKEGLKRQRVGLPAVSNIEEVARHCSDQERAAIEIERKLIEIKKCRYLEKHLGEEFDARVTGVTEKGLFAQIEGHFIDGLISAETVGRVAKARFDAETLSYRGPAQLVLSIGAQLRIQVAAVSIETRRIDFHLVKILS